MTHQTCSESSISDLVAALWLQGHFPVWDVKHLYRCSGSAICRDTCHVDSVGVSLCSFTLKMVNLLSRG